MSSSTPIKKYRQPDFERLSQVDKAWKRATSVDYHRNLRIYEELYEEAVRLGAFKNHDHSDHIEVDIRLAQALNV